MIQQNTVGREAVSSVEKLQIRYSCFIEKFINQSFYRLSSVNLLTDILCYSV